MMSLQLVKWGEGRKMREGSLGFSGICQRNWEREGFFLWILKLAPVITILPCILVHLALFAVWFWSRGLLHKPSLDVNIIMYSKCSYSPLPPPSINLHLPGCSLSFSFFTSSLSFLPSFFHFRIAFLCSAYTMWWLLHCFCLLECTRRNGLLTFQHVN